MFDGGMASNDFFNLNSNSDSDSELNPDVANNTASCSKWDWNCAENTSLYYAEKNPLKKRNVTDGQPSRDGSRNKRPCTDVLSDIPLNTTIKLGDSNLRLKHYITEHKDTVYRIHWCNHFEYKHLLLSSAADW
jgi:hypothetical protein